jgi:hypothetical protein
VTDSHCALCGARLDDLGFCPNCDPPHSAREAAARPAWRAALAIWLALALVAWALPGEW